MATVTIKEINNPHPKIMEAVVEGGAKIKWWAGDTTYTDALTVGATADVEIEKKEGKFGEERWVKSVNGQAHKKGGGGGGGGGFKGQPKDEEVIVAQVVLKGAIEAALHNATKNGRDFDLNEVRIIAKGLVPTFQETYNALKGKA